MKHLLAIILMFFSFQIMASHIVGGEISYECLGNDQYKITIKVYRDCNSNGAGFDIPLYLGVFEKGTNNRISTEAVPFTGSINLPVEFSNPCVTPPDDICVQGAEYTHVITLPPNQNGYIVTYERCCRGPGIINLMNPDSEGLTLLAEIPGTASGITCNSSPSFDNYPPLLLCNNDDLIFDHSATDPDGDILVYELCTPYHGGSNANPAPNPPNYPPPNYVVWENGFNETIPFGVNGPITIDPNTGLMVASPDLVGKFVVGVCVSEYRNGNLISTTKRDFLFTVFNCDISAAAEIVPQDELPSFNSFCDGLTINFENNSYGGTNYLWDFGVPTDPNATSTQFEPSYTFPSEGTYQVTLYMNPGWPCSDSSVQDFNVYESLNVNFEPPEDQCIDGNSFDFEGEGDYGNGASFLWEFGPNANPEIDSTEDVSGVTFNAPGVYPINYTVTWNTCEESFEDSITVHVQPIVDFDFESGLFCAPAEVQFLDESVTTSPMEYTWTFGDGASSILANPIHTYEHAGVYDVSLEIITLDGCIDTLKLEKPMYIKVYPPPIADFSVTPEVTNVFETEVFLSDHSIDSEEHFYQLNDEVDTTQRNLSFQFIEGGYHYPYQVVTNEFGCKDTAIRTIFVEPQTTFYVPTAFTPDNDDYNEVFLPIIYDVTDYQFEIYDRWGSKIFETTNTKEGWNGRVNGKIAKDGVYIWRIKYRNHREIFHEHQGHFSLLK
ncbi:PKD domain-containing protein [Brumimicrobium aurantiacum]|uniref:PKD domain-containing protein n=1 Tax=Brumimicrobium aurantiacum TaxID=1737063 RepID=A0A3E1F1Y4_9FLAO|nr:PKD domain-containing protein [Brumimicrobium aurantiacum]RFC55841.1 PKD domain-containing protein [Brumimicrobium aurantiacum]